jgi:hypothetical protein
MIGNARIVAAMVYGALVAATAMLSRSNRAIVAVVGAVVLGAFYVVTRPRRDSPR